MTRMHGTRTKYVTDKCRCDECTVANRIDARNRYRARRPATVPAATTRRHIKYLSRHGVGRRTIAAITGLAPSAITNIAAGATLRVSRKTQEAVLDVTVADAAPGAVVDGAATLAHIEMLLENGWTKTAIAKELGSSKLQVGMGGKVLVATAVKVAALACPPGGIGVDLCRICWKPTRDHSIGPCPMLGADVVRAPAPVGRQGSPSGLCVECGDPAAPDKRNGKATRYCSPECRNKMNARRSRR